jgi:putative transposase
MKKVYTDEQIVKILRGAGASGVTVKEYCREKGIHETTFYNWKKRFGTMEVEEVREYRSLQAENARLKRLLAERDLEIDAIKEVLKKKW